MPPGKQLPGNPSGPNPMDLPEVLENVFQYCPVSDLSRARLVSKLWLQTSLPIWRQRAVVRITESGLAKVWKDNSDYYGHAASMRRRWTPATSISEFVEVDLLSNAPNQRFRNFKIDLANLTKNWWGWERFWRLCGPNIRHLHLTGHVLAFDSEAKPFRDVILSSRTPALETLVIKCGYSGINSSAASGFGQEGRAVPIMMRKPSVKRLVVDVWDNDMWLPVTWEEVFNCFTHLEELSITFQRGCYPANLLVPMTSLRNMRAAGRMTRLKHLLLQEPILAESDTKQVLNLVLQCRLNLQTLKLSLGGAMTPIPQPEYYQLLESQKDTLRSLYVGKSATPHGVLPVGNSFPELDSLTISLAQWGIGGFLNNTPNLRSLTVLSRRYDSDYKYIGGGGPLPIKEIDFGVLINCPKLKRLVFQGNLPLREFRRLTEWMPNIDSLVFPLYDESFRVVCQSWRNLRHLTILENPGWRNTFVSDAGIVGRGASPNLPCISNLKDLCSLKWIRRAEPARMFQLSSASLFGGVFRLPHLHHLEINAELTQDEMELVFERVPNAVVFWRHPHYQQGLQYQYRSPPWLRLGIFVAPIMPKYVSRTNIWKV